MTNDTNWNIVIAILCIIVIATAGILGGAIGYYKCKRDMADSGLHLNTDESYVIGAWPGRIEFFTDNDGVFEKEVRERAKTKAAK